MISVHNANKIIATMERMMVKISGREAFDSIRKQGLSEEAVLKLENEIVHRANQK
jgi:uncharacterized protein YxeA